MSEMANQISRDELTRVRMWAFDQAADFSDFATKDRTLLDRVRTAELIVQWVVHGLSKDEPANEVQQ